MSNGIYTCIYTTHPFHVTWDKKKKNPPRDDIDGVGSSSRTLYNKS